MGRLTGKVIEASANIESGSVEDIGPELKKFRKMSGLTQTEMAKRLSIQQAAVSKIESGGDTHLSTIKKYVKALGASLRIDAAFPPDTPVALQLRDEFDVEAAPEIQLLLPLLGAEPLRLQRDVVLSIRPQYSDKIIEGLKTVELRRRFPVSEPRGRIAYIYSTTPVRAIIGMAEIKDVLTLPIDEIWHRYKDVAFIEKEAFYRYFDGVQCGFVLLFEKAKPLATPISLETLRAKFGFEPPQSFQYAKPDLQKALEHEYPVVSH